MNAEKWLAAHTHSLKGRRIAITGATGGIGRELCRYLCRLEAALILLDRNKERSAALERTLKEEFPAADIARIPLDLEDIHSVRDACERLKAQPPDGLIHNAGAYSIPRHRCETGLDNVFQINCASPYYLTRQLLPVMGPGARVVMVGSIAHNYSRSDPADIDFSTRKAASKVYGNAKRRLMCALYELFREETGVTLAVAHPGITFTNITAHYPKVIFALIKHPMKVIFMKPKTACLSILQGLFDTCDYHTWIGPRLFGIWGAPQKRRLHTVAPEESRRIFAETERMYREMEGDLRPKNISCV